ncbi:GNAT family N-acetyltransferase [Shewanella sp. c952]|uniref:GNAT family N-acetyltransferase n=1 Tax=Shewanella sp. c952 TaxID=2815913 RepID=UPI001BBC73F2|nr:GNAT family N-acetyltransferase [Shewanella sp. c952]GIU13324.1 GNAT family N-acetyltransferase [Shewanella sp. c952]
MAIRQLTEQDWREYKRLRLASLQDAPDSFGSTFEKEQLFSEATWRARLTPAAVTAQLPLIASVDGTAVGLAFGVLHNSGDSCAHVYQMWVANSARGRGIGKLLLQKILDWAAHLNIDEVNLLVTVDNVAAITLYQRLGFQARPELEPLRDGSKIMVQAMVYKVGPLIPSD